MKDSSITYLRKRRKGPEQQIENIAILNVTKILKNDCSLLWVGGSVPVGAGVPDMVAAVFRPCLLKLSSINSPNISLLSYLKTVGRAKEETIAKQLSLSLKEASLQIEMFREIGALVETDGVFRLHDSWKDLILEIVAIEAKVSNWKRAANQAIRNKVFCHYSYVALPFPMAGRVKGHSVFKENGIGVLGIDNDAMILLKPARKSTSIVWDYYYKVGHYISSFYRGGQNAV